MHLQSIERWQIHTRKKYTLIIRWTLAVYPKLSATIAQGLVTRRSDNVTDGKQNKYRVLICITIRTISDDALCLFLEVIQQRLEFLGQSLLVFLRFFGV